ncbi:MULTISPECIES: cupin domain-containing protein [Bacillaceae]|uniref:cupin domain-containing protein n=1 Tax=Bacillaceae TaxID=186817 RepID=UPI0013D3D04E|nr:MULTISPECIES: cupin domain-containing protein [Bacillaceae]MCC3648916.1 cupin domain-containing protein [Cytobacillus oceanisediminis]MCS0655265.1 cupin domain-containing protein [Cytobacillus firmus]
MVKYLDYTSPSLNYFFDVNNSNLMKKDNRNLINVLGIQQLNTLEDVSLLDIYLSKNNVIEPHYHQNAAELVYCISGAATVSLLNPFTKQIQNYYITPGQVANVPQGWWHYEVANTDGTHLLAIFNAPVPEVILGSDILKLTPSNIMAHTYCMDEKQWKKTVAPVKPSTFIGPTKDCSRNAYSTEPNLQYQYQHTQQYFPQHMYYY